jgi:hypothetical protein
MNWEWIRMLMNNIKSLIIHIIISTSAFIYTASPYFEQNHALSDKDSFLYAQPWTVYAIILSSSLLLYFLIGRMFLEDQFSPSRNLLSVCLVPITGMVLWAFLFAKYKASASFDFIDWKPYLIYIGYTTPLIYRYISGWHTLPFFSWIPAILLFFSIRSSR